MHDDYLEISTTGELSCLSIPQPMGPKSTPKVNTLESFPTKKHTENIFPRSQILPKSEIKDQKFKNEVFLKVSIGRSDGTGNRRAPQTSIFNFQPKL